MCRSSFNTAIFTSVCVCVFCVCFVCVCVWGGVKTLPGRLTRHTHVTFPKLSMIKDAISHTCHFGNSSITHTNHFTPDSERVKESNRGGVGERRERREERDSGKEGGG